MKFWTTRSSRTERRNAGIPKDIDDRLARDIGMTKSDLERHRFEWPSQSSDRPLL